MTKVKLLAAVLAACTVAAATFMLWPQQRRLGGELRDITPAPQVESLVPGATERHAKRLGLTQLITRTGRLADGTAIRLEASDTPAEVVTVDGEGVSHTYRATQDPGGRLIVTVPAARREREPVGAETSGHGYLTVGRAGRLLTRALNDGATTVRQTRAGLRLRSSAVVAGRVRIRATSVVVEHLFARADCARLEGAPVQHLADLRHACAS